MGPGYFPDAGIDSGTIPDSGASADVVDGMSVALAAVVHNYDEAKQDLQEKLTTFSSAVPGFPEKVNAFRQLYPVFTLETYIPTLSNNAKKTMQKPIRKISKKLWRLM